MEKNYLSARLCKHIVWDTNASNFGRECGIIAECEGKCFIILISGGQDIFGGGGLESRKSR